MKTFSEETLADLRRRLPEYMERRGFELRRRGARFVTRCPFHEDSHPSFDVFPAVGGEWRCGCFPCDFTADVFELAKRLGEGGTLPELVAHVASTLGEAPLAQDTERRAERRAPIKPARYVVPAPPSDAFERAASAARARLFNSPELCERLAAELGVHVETVKGLCFTSDGLGWDVKRQRPLYLYEHGAKIRNRAGAKTRFWWVFGNARAPWRWHYAARPEVRHVYLTESESDAIALLDAGLERLYPKDGSPASAVVACPGKDFQTAWASLFEGKRVTVVFDWDGKSDSALEKTARALVPYAEAVLVAGGKVAA